MIETFRRKNDGAETQSESERTLADEDYYVEAVLITAKNIDEVSEWSGFPITTHISGPFRGIALISPISGRHFASIGDVIFRKNYNTYAPLDHTKVRERYALS